jgi:hypothetical protein
MSSFVCVTCGVQYDDTGDRPPARCVICEDQRQYVGPGGQRWTTLDELLRRHRNELRRYEDRLVGVGTSPPFAIAQRALLVQSPGGNVLWDCVTVLDEFAERAIRDMGGVSAIAVSHPHYYSAMAEWAAAFDAPLYVHAADRRWVVRGSPALVLWEGPELVLHDGMRLLNAGGHFAGGAVLHVPFLADGRGALLTGDIIQVIPDRSHVAFMYSYPNQIPLPVTAVDRIAETVAPLAFDRIYGAWWDTVIHDGAGERVRRSAERYRRAVEGGLE